MYVALNEFLTSVLGSSIEKMSWVCELKPIVTGFNQDSKVLNL